MKKKILSAVLACAATMSLATCAFADAPATAAPGETGTPGGSETDVIEATVDLGEIDSKGVEGTKLNEMIFTGDLKDLTWKDVTSVEFTSEDLFSVQFSVKAGAIEGDADADWFTMGVDTLAKADDADKFKTAWTLGEPELKAIVAAEKPGDGFVKVIAEDGKTAKVTAKVTAKKAAAEPEKPGTNPGTGIALAVAPAALAVAFVSVAAVMSKKKKG